MASESQESRPEDEPTEPIIARAEKSWGAPQPWEDDRIAGSRHKPGAQRPPAREGAPTPASAASAPTPPPGDAWEPSPPATPEHGDAWETGSAATSERGGAWETGASPRPRGGRAGWKDEPTDAWETARTSSARADWDDEPTGEWEASTPAAPQSWAASDQQARGDSGERSWGGPGEPGWDASAQQSWDASGERAGSWEDEPRSGEDARREWEDEPEGAPDDGRRGEGEETELVGAGVSGAGADRKRRRVSGAGLIIGVLLALLGFSLVVQVKSNSTDAAYASAREGDLLQIMSELDGSETRLEQDIASLEAAKRELESGAAGQEAAQAAAKARADDMGILAGALPAQGPGVQVVLTEVSGTIRAASLLNAVQELRGGGAEAILIDATGGSVRVIASTSFVDDNGGITVDGTRLTGPYTILAIGEPDTLSDAVQFAGGVVPRVKEDGGNVIVNKRDVVEIKEVRPAPDLKFARPAS